jgi:hypothetical protein
MPGDNRRARNIAIVAVAVILFAVSVPAFLQQVLGTKISDLPNQFSLDQPSSNYSLLIFFALGMKLLGANQLVMGWSASVLLGACVALKGILSLHVLSRHAARTLLPAGVALALAFAMPLPNWWKPTGIYLGQFAPTIWHNPTTIVAMPAAIVAFFTCMRSLTKPTLVNSALTSGVFVLAAALKPAYVGVLLPVFLPWFGWRARHVHHMPWGRIAAHAAILAAPLLIVLAVQSFLAATLRNSWVTIAPFAVWSIYSPNPLASLFLSVAFPASVGALYWDKVKGNTAVFFAWLTFVAAVVVFAVLAETGTRFRHANFSWGAAMANYILFLASSDIFFRQPMTRRSVPVLSLFLMHVASGLYFYWRIATGAGYYS